MAIFQCLHHRPTERHYRSYARPLAYLEQPCTEPGCTGRVVVWLDPEEVKDFERGSRLFHDAEYNALGVDDRDLSRVGPGLRLPRVNLRLLGRLRLKGTTTV